MSTLPKVAVLGLGAMGHAFASNAEERLYRRRLEPFASTRRRFTGAGIIPAYHAAAGGR
jgi:3-hydroxyisobutyrate dehydrogenase-like beta-hydroxyacid dehydrogenase